MTEGTDVGVAVAAAAAATAEPAAWALGLAAEVSTPPPGGPFLSPFLSHPWTLPSAPFPEPLANTC